jgi:hypothetical protein
MTTKTLSIDLLRIDADTQARVAISGETVDEYAEVIEGEKKWPLGAIDVFYDGTDYFVADGFHRTLAAIRVKRASIPCKIHKGTARDARVFGMTANDSHGLRMSRADKRKCVEWLLDNGGKMSQVKIAEKAGVTVRTVERIVADRKPQNPTLSGSTTQPTGDGKDTEPPKPPGGEPAKSGGSGSKPGKTTESKGGGSPAEPPKVKAEWRIARSKTKKTVEALMRALDDLNDVRPISFRDQSLNDCRAIINELDAME